MKINEQLEAIDMSQDGMAQATMTMLVEHIMKAVGQHRLMAAKAGVSVDMDSTIMSALVVCAGLVHGELVATGQVHDNITPEALNLMLTDNFDAGKYAAFAKVDDYRRKHGCGDPECGVCAGVAGEGVTKQ